MDILVRPYLSKVNKCTFSYILVNQHLKVIEFKNYILLIDPIKNVKTQGNVWIQEGEMLNLQVMIKI